MTYSTRSKRLIIGIFIAFLTLASLSLCSKLSPLVFSAQNPDPMSFFMSAKAWANGLLPYRDTVDYKGPFLYLIYMAGYLISPRSTCGVFLVQALFMGVTLSLLYRVARLFLRERRRALLAMVLTLPFFLSPAFHLDGRAEELALPFLALLMYTTCRLLKATPDTRGVYRKRLIQAAWATGGGCAALFLIKYNICLPFAASFVVVMGLCLYERRRREAWLYLFHTGLSFLAVLLPFFLYFLYTHTLGDFLSVYFSFVNKTYQSGEPASLLSKIKSLIACYCLNIYALPLWLALACLLPYSPFADSSPLRDKAAIRLWLIIFIIATFIAGSPYLWSNMGFLYYTYIFVPASIVVTMGLASAVRKAGSPLALGVLGCVVLVFSIQLNRNGAGKECVFSPYHRGDLLMEQELLSKDSPKVLYLGTLEQGYGIAAHALPAAPCWSGLNKATEEFKEMQAQAVRERKADYVFCRYLGKSAMLKTNVCEFEEQEKFIKYRELLEASGYELLYLTENPQAVTGMWRKK